jgi:hypothetical protein
MSPPQAIACGVCTTALIDYILPPVGLWSLLAIVWFLVLSCLVNLRGERIHGVPSFYGALALLLGLFIIGILGFGPLGLLMLFMIPLGVAARAFWGKARYQWSYVLARDLKFVSIIGLAIFVGLAAYSAYIQRVRSPAEYALQWEGTYTGKQVLMEIAFGGEETRPELQHLITHGKPSTIAQLASKLAALNRPETDVPVLILSLGQCRGYGDCEKDVSAALRKLTGLDLEDGTSAKSWQERWHQRLTHMSQL